MEKSVERQSISAGRQAAPLSYAPPGLTVESATGTRSNVIDGELAAEMGQLRSVRAALVILSAILWPLGLLVCVGGIGAVVYTKASDASAWAILVLGAVALCVAAMMKFLARLGSFSLAVIDRMREQRRI